MEEKEEVLEEMLDIDEEPIKEEVKKEETKKEEVKKEDNTALDSKIVYDDSKKTMIRN